MQLESHRKRPLALGLSVAGLIASLSLSACADSHGGTDSSTHWLRACEADTDCAGLECLCGVCSQACAGEAECQAVDGAAVCRRGRDGECSTAAELPRLCVAECGGDDDCPAGRGLACVSGRCRPGSDGPQDGGPQGPGSTVAEPGGDACTPMDAVSNCDDCAVDGYAWDGELCNIRVECMGSDCDSLYGSFAECQRAHAACLGIDACDPMHHPAYVCDSAYGGDMGHVWNGATCEPVRCGACEGPGCSRAVVADPFSTCLEAFSTCAEGPQGVSIECATPADCVLDAKDCCPPCAFTLDSMVAVATESLDNHRLRACREPTGCDPCAPPANEALYADCESGRCIAMDRDRFAACESDEDCFVMLRACCECNASPADLVAVSDATAYRNDICRQPAVCPDCAGPGVPPDASARCEAGYCALE